MDADFFDGLKGGQVRVFLLLELLSLNVSGRFTNHTVAIEIDRLLLTSGLDAAILVSHQIRYANHAEPCGRYY